MEPYYGFIDVPSGYYATPTNVDASKRSGYSTCPPGSVCSNGVRVPSAVFQASICIGDVHTLQVNEKEDYTSTESFSLSEAVDGLTTTFALKNNAASSHPFTLLGDGRLQVSEHLDFNAKKSYELELDYKVDGELIEHCSITVEVIDVNEAPVITNAAAERKIKENEAPGAIVDTKVLVTDNDLFDSAKYEITSGASDKFMIDCSGTLIALTTFNFEDTNSYSLTIKVTDEGGLTDSETVTITIEDVPEAPSCVATTYSVAESAALDTQVGTFTSSASDPDAGDLAALKYEIVYQSASPPYFSAELDGAFKVIRKLDFETLPSIVLKLKVVDPLGNTGTCIHIVELTDANDAPEFDEIGISVPENCHDTICYAGDLTKFVTDQDGDSVSFSITSGGDKGTLVAKCATWTEHATSVSTLSGLEAVTASNDLWRFVDPANPAKVLIIRDPSPVSGQPIWQSSSATIECSKDGTEFKDVAFKSLTACAAADGIGTHDCSGAADGWILWNAATTSNANGGHPCAVGSGLTTLEYCSALESESTILALTVSPNYEASASVEFTVS